MRTLHEEAHKSGAWFTISAGKCVSPPAMQAAKTLVKERRLGEIYFAETMWVRSRGTPGWLSDGWFTERSRDGGGAIIDLGVHAN